MATLTEITVPDIGDFDAIPVIEILVAPGDVVSAETPLITLESDKATMDVPAPMGGVVREIKVAIGDHVSRGTPIVLLDTGTADEQVQATEQVAGHDEASTSSVEPEPVSAPPSPAPDAAAGAAKVLEIKVPDIGDFENIPVIELLVSVGDTVQAETPLVTLESDKATMDVPSPGAGVITELKVAIGDTVSQGSLVALLRTGGGNEAEASGAAAPTAPAAPLAHPANETAVHAAKEKDAAPAQRPGSSGAVADGTPNDGPSPAVESMQKFHSSAPDPRAPLHRLAPTAGLDEAAPSNSSHATPAVRRFARELGVELSRVSGSGRKGRILREDINTYVKGALSASSTPASGGAASAMAPRMGIEPIPAVDFSRFGPIEEQKLSRIKRISGPFLQRAWLNIPHVTNHDEVDITEMEAFRKSLADEAQRRGVRVTALTFIMKAVVNTLATFPSVNSSLSSDGTSLILKRYFHIGVAVDTPNGLVVPVFRDVDQKGIFELAAEMADVSVRARDGKLKPDELQGGCMSISSLGGIGGTGFTPIVNAPEVAILGVSRAKMQPVWDGTSFVPRLMLPLDLSYDHRVVDGAEAARFLAHLGGLLTDLRRLML